MSATATISKPTSSSLRRDDDAATTPLTMAAEANMFVKLHVKDGCGNGVVIPLKDLLAKSENTHTASYSTLRRFALAALFKHEDIPEYAHENFQTCFTCTHHTSDSGGTGTGTQTLMRNDNDLTIVLEEASADRLMDDNDNIVVDIHCTFVNTFKFDKGEMFRESATAAADNAKKAMKTWFEKASSLFQRFVTDGEDYVVVSKNKGHNKDNVHPAEWASRFVQFLFTERVPSQQHQKKQQQTRAGCSVRPTVRVHNKKQQLAPPQVHKANSLETAEDMVDVAIVGFNMATEIFNEAILRHEDAVRNFFHTRKMKRANKNKEACQISSSSSNNNDSSVSSSSSKASLPSVTSPVDISRDDSEVEGEEEEEFNLDRGVEIEFDPENESNELTEDEWKIFFTNSTEEVEEEESGAVLLDVPSEQDVVSISSSDESTECQQSAAASMSNDSDDDSWALLDDDE